MGCSKPQPVAVSFLSTFSHKLLYFSMACFTLSCWSAGTMHMQVSTVGTGPPRQGKNGLMLPGAFAAISSSAAFLAASFMPSPIPPMAPINPAISESAGVSKVRECWSCKNAATRGGAGKQRSNTIWTYLNLLCIYIYIYILYIYTYILSYFDPGISQEPHSLVNPLSHVPQFTSVTIGH